MIPLAPLGAPQTWVPAKCGHLRRVWSETLSFISAMEGDGSARAIVRAIVGLGRSLNLPIVAEESKPQRSTVW